MEDLPDIVWWIVIVDWKNGTHSFQRVQGFNDGPDMSTLFWQIDEDGDPYSAKIWFTKSRSDIHIVQEADGVWVSKRDEIDAPLDRYVFPSNFIPCEDACTCNSTCKDICMGECGCRACEIRFRNHRPDE